ncbi:MAG TPA: STAS domain-containing protein [Acidimicrobiales bacterium]|jgi:hypothetical protein|nr:STAS domain-containing protein [Acidimicrobiales bacterium]
MTAAASPTRPPSGGHDGRNAAHDDQDSPAITVHQEGTTVVIAVEGNLNLPTGEALLNAVDAAVGTETTRLDIDLRALDDFSAEGASALVSCRELGAKLAEGLHYRTGRGPGREALLAAYTDIDLDSDVD